MYIKKKKQELQKVRRKMIYIRIFTLAVITSNEKKKYQAERNEHTSAIVLLNVFP